MTQAYDRWWSEILRALENENAEPPALALYKKLYYDQFGGAPGPSTEAKSHEVRVARPCVPSVHPQNPKR